MTNELNTSLPVGQVTVNRWVTKVTGDPNVLDLTDACTPTEAHLTSH